MFKVLSQTAIKYRKDQSGQFAVLFGLIIVPMMIAIAYVGDMTYAGKVKSELNASLDAAALAAVINQNFNETERAKFATDHFNENFEFSSMFTLNVVDASPKRVELSATGGFPSYIGAMTGQKTFDITTHATSVLTSEDIICMLALDPSSEGAFSVTKGASFYGKDCSVQVNSSHASAAIVDSKSDAVAKAFCTTGGAKGTYTPYANSDCARIDDPFANVPGPVVNPLTDCSSLGALSASNLTGAIQEMAQWLVITNNAVLLPGVYCKTISFEGTNITLMPGNYIFQENVSFFNGSHVKGNGVTLILNGPNSTMELMGGSSLVLKAPPVGTYAGLAIFQNRHTAGSGTGMSTASGTSEIRNGSDMDITGTVYLPTQRIYIGRDGNTSVTSKYVTVAPATSFIAHQIHLDSSITSVAVDHLAAGLPPMLPRSDTGARLIE